MDKPISVDFAILELSNLHMNPIMINYNPILEKKIFNVVIWLV